MGTGRRSTGFLLGQVGTNFQGRTCCPSSTDSPRGNGSFPSKAGICHSVFHFVSSKKKLSPAQKVWTFQVVRF